MTEAELLSSLQQAIASELEREPPLDVDGLAAFREAIEHTDASLLYHYHHAENSGNCSPRLPLGTSPSAYSFASVPKKETSRSLGRSLKANVRHGSSGTPPRRASLSRDPAYSGGGGKKQQTAANGAAGAPVGRRRKRVHRHEGWSYRILWLPVLLCILCIVGFELLVYVVVRQTVNLYEYFCLWRGRKFRLRMQLRQTKSYSEWKAVALALDAFMGKDEWKKEEAYRYYDHVLIRKLVRHLVMYRRALGDPSQSPAPASLTGSMVAASPESNGTGSGSGVRERILGTTEPRRPAPTISDAWAVTLSAPCILEGGLDEKERNSGRTSADNGLGPPDRGISPSGMSNSASLAKLKEVLLQGGVKSNVGGVENDWLYKQTYFGTKELVERFYEEVALSLETIGNFPPSILSTEDKRAFFRRADRTYGRTALCLSGGAAFGYYHLGVCKALLEGGVLPQVITGTSAGSLIAALICCRTDSELRQVLKPALYKRLTACGRGPLYEWFLYLQRYCTIGAMYDANSWAEKTQWVTRGNMTFLEAYKRTGRILNITAVPNESHSPPKLLNYITTPDTVIWSAVLASSAVPGMLKPVVLMNKTPEGKLVPFVSTGVKWRDGSLRTDIPLQELQQYFDVKYTIVSQVNPHISIFFFESRGSVGRPSAHRNGSGWRGGFALAGMEHYLKLDLKKWLRVIRDLDLMPNFLQIDWRFLWLQKFDGNITILPKSSVGDFVHILTDPTEERLANYIARGERNTWPKIHMIRNRMLPERTIIRGMLKARKEMRGMRAAASAASSLESLSPGSLAEDASKVPGLPPARTAHTPFARDEAEVPAQHPTNEEQNEIERERRAGKRELLARAGAATPPAAPAAAIDSAVSSSVSSLDRSFASATSPDSDVEDGSLAFLETPRDAFQAPAEEAQHWTTDSEGDEEDEVDPERWEDKAEERAEGARG